MTTNRMDVVNLQTACAIIGKSANTLKGWFRRGCPVVQEGTQNKEWQISIPAVFDWRAEQAATDAIGDTVSLDLEEAKRRKLAAEAALAELELAKEQNKVVEIDQVARVVGEEYANCRARLLAIPSKLAPLLDATPGINAKRDLIEQAITEALDELTADGAADLGPVDGGAEGSQTTES